MVVSGARVVWGNIYKEYSTGNCILYADDSRTSWLARQAVTLLDVMGEELGN